MKRLIAISGILALGILAPVAIAGQVAARGEKLLAISPRPSEAAPAAVPAGPPQAKAPQWKSRAEYDAFQSIVKATSPDAKITAANAFLAKYPTSDFKARAGWLKLQAYVQMNNVSEAVTTAKGILSDSPDDTTKLVALHYLAFVFPYTYKPSAADGASQLSDAQSQGKEGLQLLQQIQKPAGVSQDAFETQIKKFRADFNRELGFAALEQKDFPSAITYLKASAEDNAKDSYAISFLGQAYLYSKPPDYNNALWYLARATALAKSADAPNTAALQKLYDQWYEFRHGSNAGEQSVVTEAASAPNPPAGFNVTTPLKHAKTGNAAVDAYYSMQDALSVGGDATQSAWNGYKGQPLAILGYVESVSKGSDPGTYSVRTDVLPQQRGQTGTYQLILLTNQADAKYLQLGDPMHFKGTISAYTMTPNFVLTISDVQIDPATLRMAKEREEAKAQKASQKKKHP
jgi:hypothetical protein